MNGRVNIIQPPDGLKQISLYDKIPAKGSSYTDAVQGTYYETDLSKTFFSKENHEIIQNGIRKGVYDMSNQKHIIGYQDVDTLKVIMRSIFLTHSENSPKDIKGQIERLNKKVLDYIIPTVYGEVIGYLNYVKDVSTIPTPISYPVLSRLNDKQLQENRWLE